MDKNMNLDKRLPEKIIILAGRANCHCHESNNRAIHELLIRTQERGVELLFIPIAGYHAGAFDRPHYDCYPDEYTLWLFDKTDHTSKAFYGFNQIKPYLTELLR